MKFNIRRWPSGGFLLLMASHLLLVFVFAWGYSQPELERAWAILQASHRDSFIGLSTTDVGFLRRLLKKCPPFARAILGNASIGFVEPSDSGWISRSSAHVVVQPSPGTRRFLVVECRARLEAFPVTVNLESDRLRQSLQFSENGRQSLELVAENDAYPIWATLRIQSSTRTDNALPQPEIHVEVSPTTEPKAAP